MISEKNRRWTILNISESVKKKIVEYAKQNGFKIPRAIEELTAKELEKWESEKKKQ
jgi:hypothetical protein